MTERETWGKSYRNHLVTMRKETWRRKARMQRMVEHWKGRDTGP